MKQINYAVIGVNQWGIGKQHALAILDTEGAKLCMVCDNDAEAANLYDNQDSEIGVACEARALGVPYCTDWHKIAEDPQIDAVVVATPDYTHREIVVGLLAAGKHVLCEKPMALTREDCVEMIRAAKRYDRHLMVGQICRKNPTFVRAKELVDRGEIGELFFVECEYAHDYGIMNSSWRKDPKHPRPIIIGGGCHAVDLLRWIAGNPSEVFAYGNRKVYQDYFVDDSTVALLKFPNDVMGKVFCSMSTKRRQTMRTVLYGTRGTIVVDDYRGEFILYKDHIVGDDPMYLDGRAHDVEMHFPITAKTHNCKGEIEDFTAVLRGEMPLTIDGVEGGSTVAVCAAIVESTQIGDKVQISYDFFEER